MTKFEDHIDFAHDNSSCTGILITNLGTPDAPTPSAVRRYLGEFLADPRIVEMPRWLWMIALHGIILRIRPKKAAKSYQSVWTDKGSPLLYISEELTRGVQKACQDVAGPIKIELAMRYGQPSIPDGLQALQKAGARRILLLPLYPQYSATTTASTFDAVSRVLRKWRWIPELRTINHYHDHPLYIQAMADSIRKHWQAHEQADKLLFSFHGLPKKYLLKGDPYFCECLKTARLVAENLQLDADRWHTSFQSRFGREQWLTPYTDHTLQQWGEQGIPHVQVICPGFPIDCLETLEEIAVENRDVFLAAGGKQYSYIPALNAQPQHIELLMTLIKQHTAGWLNTAQSRQAEPDNELQNRQQRAINNGADK